MQVAVMTVRVHHHHHHQHSQASSSAVTRDSPTRGAAPSPSPSLSPAGLVCSKTGDGGGPTAGTGGRSADDAPGDGDGGDDGNSCGGDSCTTVLSEDYDCEPDDACDSGHRGGDGGGCGGGGCERRDGPQGGVRDLAQDWRRLRDRFAARDAALREVARLGRSRRYAALLHRNEARVRERLRERLMRRTRALREAVVPGPPQELEQLDAIIADLTVPKEPWHLPDHCPDQGGWFEGIRDTLTFELYATLPAVLSLLVHTLAHTALYDAVQYPIHELRKYLVAATGASVEGQLALVSMLVGVLLLRLSGYLYWWCSPPDYQCAKFDYHNRLRLGRWDARCLLWVRRRDALRAACYMVGYYLLFSAVIYGQARLLRRGFDQRTELLRDLPSATYQQGLDVCLDALVPEVDGSPYSFSCQHQLESLRRRREELLDADMAYTWNMLSGHSFDMFWVAVSQKIEEADQSAILSPVRGIMSLGLLFIGCVGLLRLYGFVFWYKY